MANERLLAAEKIASYKAAISAMPQGLARQTMEKLLEREEAQHGERLKAAKEEMRDAVRLITCGIVESTPGRFLVTAVDAKGEPISLRMNNDDGTFSERTMLAFRALAATKDGGFVQTGDAILARLRD